MNQKVLFSLARALKVYFNHAVVVGLLVLLAACASAPASPSGDEVLPNAGTEPTEAAAQSSSGASPSGGEVLPNVSMSEPTPINAGTEPPSPGGAPASCDPDYVAAKVAAKSPGFFDADLHLVGDGQGNPILDVGVDTLVFVARYKPNGSGGIGIRTGVIVDSDGHVMTVMGRVTQDLCTVIAVPRRGSFRGTMLRTDVLTGARIFATEGTTALPSAEFGSGASLATGQKVVSYQKRAITQPWTAVPGTARSLKDWEEVLFGFVTHPDVLRLVGRPESVGDAVFDEVTSIGV